MHTSSLRRFFSGCGALAPLSVALSVSVAACGGSTREAPTEPVGAGGIVGVGGGQVDGGVTRDDAAAAGAHYGGVRGGNDGGMADQAVPPGPQLCGGVECTPSEKCCLSGLYCFDPTVDSCEASVPLGYEGEQHCASDADCTPSQFCRLYGAFESLCAGSGSCVERTMCGWCLAATCSPVCGCDGKTYPDIQTACLAGTNYQEGPCGAAVSMEDYATEDEPTRQLTRCGTDKDCPTDERCCAITATCFDPSVPELCRMPPANTRFPCVDDAQCRAAESCVGDGCEGGGGGCFVRSSECGELVDPVCGCDGETYRNRGCAFAAGVRIASEGECQ